MPLAFLPTGAITGLIVLFLFQLGVGGLSDWQLVVIAFAAGGLAMQQRQILRTMVTKEDLATLKMELSETYQHKEHKRGASAGATH
jgi:hypothetical protein